jgi:hypothetical protein
VAEVQKECLVKKAEWVCGRAAEWVFGRRAEQTYCAKAKCKIDHSVKSEI